MDNELMYVAINGIGLLLSVYFVGMFAHYWHNEGKADQPGQASLSFDFNDDGLLERVTV